MKKLLVCLSLVAALTIPAVAGEKSEKAADKACCKEKAAACPEKAKAGCKEKSACKESAAKKSASANVKGAQVLKQ